MDRISIKRPEDLIAAVPVLLGFHPSASMVVLAEGGPRNPVVLRFDLPGADDAAHEEHARQASAFLTRHGFCHALLAGYGSQSRVAPFAQALIHALTGTGIDVVEALRVEDGLWWCCLHPGPSEGVPFDLSTNLITVQAVAEGHVALNDRSDHERALAPVAGAERDRMNEATAEAIGRRAAWDRLPGPRRQALIEDEAVPMVRSLTAKARLSDEEAAWLSVLLNDQRLRDEAWVGIGERGLREEIEFWMDLTRRVDDRFAAAPATLLAFAAFRSGDGALANVALDRAQDADPSYPAAHLIRKAMSIGLHPQEAGLDMTRQELAEIYGQATAPDAA